jgi:hypothetical protein
MDDAAFLAYTTRVQRDISFYLVYAFIPVGLSLNFLSLMVYNRERLRKQSFSFYYMISLSIDSSMLLINFFTHNQYNTGMELSLLNTANCRLISFLRRYSNQASSWWLVFMTLNRTLIIKYPKRFEFFKSKKLLLAILFIGLFVLAVWNWPNYLLELVVLTTRSNETNVTVTRRLCTSSPTLLLIRDMCAQFSRTIIPYISMIFLNSILIKALIDSKKKFLAKNDSMRKEYLFAIGLILNNTIFFMILSPLLLSTLVLNYYQFILNMPLSTRTMIAISFVNNVTISIALLNQMLPFVSNIAFNKLFRGEFLSMLKDLRYYVGHKNNRIGISKQNTNTIHTA